jgi:tetratricopeptide (TPR) repeat protein
VFAACALAIVLLWAGSAGAQIPDKFTNLKVLPEDISKREMMNIMRGFAMSLGTRCHHCHVGEPDQPLDTYDFAADDKEPKKVARAMMKLTGEINTTLLPTTERTELTEVRCVTCHRGLENPETLDRVLLADVKKDGVPAAVAHYRELRSGYYGIGAYDFSAGTLNQVAESIAREGNDVDGAIELVKLNLEFNPEDAFTHLSLGQLHSTKGDKAAAIASIQKCLELDPENHWAKQLLEKVQAPE